MIEKSRKRAAEYALKKKRDQEERAMRRPSQELEKDLLPEKKPKDIIIGPERKALPKSKQGSPMQMRRISSPQKTIPRLLSP